MKTSIVLIIYFIMNILYVGQELYIVHELFTSDSII